MTFDTSEQSDGARGGKTKLFEDQFTVLDMIIHLFFRTEVVEQFREVGFELADVLLVNKGTSGRCLECDKARSHALCDTCRAYAELGGELEAVDPGIL